MTAARKPASAKTTPPKTTPERRKLLGKLHIARKQMALEDGTYRALLHRVTGAESAADLKDGQIVAVIEELKRLGWKDRPGAPKRAGKRPIAPGPQAAKARALWLALYHLGAIADPAEAKLDLFCKRMTGTDSLRFLDPETADRLIRSLRGWCERFGYTEPSTVVVTGWNLARANAGLTPEYDHGQACKVALIIAIWTRLADTGAFRTGDQARIGSWLMGAAGVQAPWFVAPEKLDPAIERLGRWLRDTIAKFGEPGGNPEPPEDL